MSGWINVSIDVTSAANQMSTDVWSELFNALGERFQGFPEQMLERMRSDVGDELDDNGKAFLKACHDYFREQFPRDA